jgi:hypothetical protein
MAPGTVAQFIAQLDARLGKPYSETIDGGVGPDYYDCSGLVEVCLNAIGIPYTRTTYSQWADERYEHFGPFAFGAPLPALLVGDVLYMHVDGEADPGHVGVYVGSGQYLNAPHTGAVVRVEEIPNSSSEHVYGIIRPPFSVPGPAPTPTPTPTPQPQEAQNMQCTDPVTGGVWTLGPDGHVEGEPEAAGGPPYLGALNGNRFNWQAVGQLVGFSARIDGNGQWGYDIAVSHSTPDVNGSWFSHYTFPRNGSLATTLDDAEADAAAYESATGRKLPAPA